MTLNLATLLTVAILPTLPQHSSSPLPFLTYLCTFKDIIKIDLLITFIVSSPPT